MASGVKENGEAQETGQEKGAATEAKGAHISASEKGWFHSARPCFCAAARAR
jgi:hypothetical protein